MAGDTVDETINKYSIGSHRDLVTSQGFAGKWLIYIFSLSFTPIYIVSYRERPTLGHMSHMPMPIISMVHEQATQKALMVPYCDVHFLFSATSLYRQNRKHLVFLLRAHTYLFSV